MDRHEVPCSQSYQQNMGITENNFHLAKKSALAPRCVIFELRYYRLINQRLACGRTALRTSLSTENVKNSTAALAGPARPTCSHAIRHLPSAAQQDTLRLRVFIYTGVRFARHFPS